MEDTGLAVVYVVLVVIGAMVTVPDPTLAMPLVAAVVGIGVVGYASYDGSMRELAWGIAALYAVGIPTAVAFSFARLHLLGVVGPGLLQATPAILAIGALLGGYVFARRRGGADRTAVPTD